MTHLTAMVLAAALPLAEAPEPAQAEAAPLAAEAPAQAEAAPLPLATPAADVAATNAVDSAKAGKGAKKKVTIKVNSDKADYDNKSGAMLFEGNVRVDGEEFFLEADTGCVFMEGTNDVKMIVVTGNVKIRCDSPETLGTCAKAAFVKASGRIVMHGDAASPAKLVTKAPDKGEGRGGFKGGALEGRKITFWLDSEQVEVDGSTVTIEAEQKPGGEKDDWKKRILGR